MADAPRFRLSWGMIEGTSVLTMSREDWHTAVGTIGAPVIFDVCATPLSGITHVSSVVAAVARQFSPATTQISFFRHDPKDAPYSINHDEYDVWTDLSSHPRLHEMINRDRHLTMRIFDLIARTTYSWSNENLALTTG